MDSRFLSRLQADPVDTGMGFFRNRDHGAGIAFQGCCAGRFLALDADGDNMERGCSDVSHAMDVRQSVVVGTEPDVTGFDVRLSPFPTQGFRPYFRSHNRDVKQVKPVFMVEAHITGWQKNIQDHGVIILKYRFVPRFFIYRDPVFCMQSEAT